MEKSELIHKFIDEGLDPISEQTLFEEMAKNPSLRTEFRNYLAFEKAAIADFGAFQPSLNATNAIFSTLGISTTAETAATASGLSFWAKYGNIILSNIATFFVTTALIYFLGIFQNNNTINHNNQLVKNTDQPEKVNQFPIVENSELKKKPIEKINNATTKQNLVYATQNKFDRKSDSEVIENSNVNSDENTNIKIWDNKEIENTTFSQNFAVNQLKTTNFNNSKHPELQLPIFDFTDNSINLENLSIIFTGNDSYSLPRSPLPRSSQPIFDSKSLVVLYDLTQSVSIGLDFRQEFYYLDYIGTIGDKEYRYEQNTNFSSIGLLAKWNYLDMKYFKPFGTLYLGGNKIGQIGRIMLGGEISISNDYGFVIGVEGSILRHFHQNKDFYAKKIGLNYGIIFHF